MTMTRDRRHDDDDNIITVHNNVIIDNAEVIARVEDLAKTLESLYKEVVKIRKQGAIIMTTLEDFRARLAEMEALIIEIVGDIQELLASHSGGMSAAEEETLKSELDVKLQALRDAAAIHPEPPV